MKCKRVADDDDGLAGFTSESLIWKKLTKIQAKLGIIFHEDIDKVIYFIQCIMYCNSPMYILCRYVSEYYFNFLGWFIVEWIRNSNFPF